MAFGIDRAMIAAADRSAGASVFVMVGTDRQAREAIGRGADRADRAGM